MTTCLGSKLSRKGFEFKSSRKGFGPKVVRKGSGSSGPNHQEKDPDPRVQIIRKRIRILGSKSSRKDSDPPRICWRQKVTTPTRPGFRYFRTTQPWISAINPCKGSGSDPRIPIVNERIRIQIVNKRIRNLESQSWIKGFGSWNPNRK